MGVIFEWDTLLEQDGVRFLRSDGNLHSAVEVESRRPWIVYPRMAAAVLLFGDEPENLLILGMGAGSVGTYLHAQVPDLRVDYVDIDPAVPELAREFLFFDDHPGSRVFIDDAHHFLQERPGETWDVIYADTYIGHSIPFHLSTVEFFEEVKRHLGDEGFFGVNLVPSAPPSCAACGRSFVTSTSSGCRAGTISWSPPIATNIGASSAWKRVPGSSMRASSSIRHSPKSPDASIAAPSTSKAPRFCATISPP